MRPPHLIGFPLIMSNTLTNISPKYLCPLLPPHPPPLPIKIADVILAVVKVSIERYFDSDVDHIADSADAPKVLQSPLHYTKKQDNRNFYLLKRLINKKTTSGAE
ncbi:hypothetical protein D1970_18270 [Mesobacillus zeae]|uniref:Uncharacterized protein n=1 Tax=Mesobacillus zeae TaxID=1917180 RepID=A0A398AYD6_9BACI|nr:hypothetical protein D1970_18270 [Mesobacillus zeae]